MFLTTIVKCRQNALKCKQSEIQDILKKKKMQKKDNSRHITDFTCSSIHKNIDICKNCKCV